MKKIALITGGHHSLGFAISETFAKNNYDLIITYHNNEEKAKKTQEYLKENYKVNVDLFKVDFNNLSSTSAFTNLIKNKYSYLDVIINNAAYTKEEEFTTKDSLEFQKILNVNTIAPFIISQNLASMLNENSSIVNIASTNGIDTYSPLTLEYDASKAALISLTKNLAITLSPKTRVNAVAPGWINTQATSEMNPIYKENELKRICLNRFSEPQEIASVVYFLTTEEAKYINGSIIRVDGGLNVTR